MKSRFAKLVPRTTPVRRLTMLIQTTLLVLLALALFSPSANAQPLVYVVTLSQQLGPLTLRTANLLKSGMERPTVYPI